MKQKGLPLVSNKAAPCTVLSHSLVDSAPPCTPNKRTDTYRQTEASHNNRASHIWHESHPATVLHFPSSAILMNQHIVTSPLQGFRPSAHSYNDFNVKPCFVCAEITSFAHYSKECI